MKKWLCTVLAVSMLTGILTGCGSTSGQAEADAPAVESQDTETVADLSDILTAYGIDVSAEEIRSTKAEEIRTTIREKAEVR